MRSWKSEVPLETLRCDILTRRAVIVALSALGIQQGAGEFKFFVESLGAVGG